MVLRQMTARCESRHKQDYERRLSRLPVRIGWKFRTSPCKKSDAARVLVGNTVRLLNIEEKRQKWGRAALSA
jgi:hypothetical protein